MPRKEFVAIGITIFEGEGQKNVKTEWGMGNGTHNVTSGRGRERKTKRREMGFKEKNIKSNLNDWVKIKKE